MGMDHHRPRRNVFFDKAPAFAAFDDQRFVVDVNRQIVAINDKIIDEPATMGPDFGDDAVPTEFRTASMDCCRLEGV